MKGVGAKLGDTQEGSTETNRTSACEAIESVGCVKSLRCCLRAARVLTKADGLEDVRSTGDTTIDINLGLGLSKQVPVLSVELLENSDGRNTAVFLLAGRQSGYGRRRRDAEHPYPFSWRPDVEKRERQSRKRSSAMIVFLTSVITQNNTVDTGLDGQDGVLENHIG